jgi:oxaloacetate decarboxylase gamma subunit
VFVCNVLAFAGAARAWPVGCVEITKLGINAMDNTLINDGLMLMAFGMGTVFVFLLVLIGATTLMSFLVQRFFPQAPPVAPAMRAPATNAVASDDQLTAVISTAVHKYRSRQK